jgi:hypothetical protein
MIYTHFEDNVPMPEMRSLQAPNPTLVWRFDIWMLAPFICDVPISWFKVVQKEEWVITI